MASLAKNEAWLHWMEQLVTVSATPEQDPGLARALFHCRLDDQPDHLVPEHCLRRSQDWVHLAGRPFFVNPGCHFSRNDDLPLEISVSQPDLSRFALRGDMIWLHDSGHVSLQPFWLGEELARTLRGVRPGDRAPVGLPSRAVDSLALANVLVDGDYFARRRREWRDLASRYQAAFQQDGYVPLGMLVHPFHIASLRRYYRNLLRAGKMRLGDDQSARRYVQHNESVASFFHHHITQSVCDIVGEAVKPSYCYFASYQPGATLKEHLDREQCEFSITLCLDYAPEPQSATPWPIHLRTKAGKVTVFQAIGDALLYRGRDLPHWRDALPAGHSSTSIFFHYVRENFAGKLE